MGGEGVFWVCVYRFWSYDGGGRGALKRVMDSDQV